MASSDDNVCSTPEVDAPEALAELWGTPPTRNTANGIARRQNSGRAATRRVRELSRDAVSRKDSLDTAAAARRRVSSSRHQRRRDRKGARTFKELDTTLQVLGIGDSTAAAPATNLRVTTSPHVPVTAIEAGPGSPGEYASPLRKLQPSSSQLSDASSGSKGAAGQRSNLTAAFQQQSLNEARHSSAQRGDGPVTPESLQSAREEWRAGLDDVLDSDADLQRLRTRADDLKVELIRLQTPPDSNWPAREKHLDWLESALLEVKAIADPLTSHNAAGMEPAVVQQNLDIVKDLVPEVKGMASICSDAVTDGVREVGQQRFSGTYTKLALRILHRQLQDLIRLSNWLQSLGRIAARKGLSALWAEQASRQLGERGYHMVQEAIELASGLQAALFSPGALSASLGAGGAHELSSQVKSLQVLWPALGHRVAEVAHAWPNLSMPVRRLWCELHLTAARQAETMQKQHISGAQQDSSRLWMEDPDRQQSGPSGVWAVRTAACPSVTDGHLVAQAWLPSMLQRYLAEAQKAAQALLDTDGGSAELAEGPESLVEQLSRAVYDLSLAGMWRVHRMCGSLQGLSSWALELLLEQASQALVFVRDLDSGPLGFCAEDMSQSPSGDGSVQGSQGFMQPDMFKVLSKATHCLVNEVLSLRQLLKRRAADDHFDIPRPILLTRSESVSSITESTVSTFSRPSSPPSTARADWSTPSSRVPSRGPSIAAELVAQADAPTVPGQERRASPAPQPARPASPPATPPASNGFRFPVQPQAMAAGSPEALRIAVGAAPREAPAQASSSNPAGKPEPAPHLGPHPPPAKSPAAQPARPAPPEANSNGRAVPIPVTQPFKAALLKPGNVKQPSFRSWANRQPSGSLEASPASSTGRDLHPSAAPDTAVQTPPAVLQSPFSEAAKDAFPQTLSSQPISIPRKPAGQAEPTPARSSSISPARKPQAQAPADEAVQAKPGSAGATASVAAHAYVLPALPVPSPFEAPDLQAHSPFLMAQANGLPPTQNGSVSASHSVQQQHHHHGRSHAQPPSSRYAGSRSDAGHVVAPAAAPAQPALRENGIASQATALGHYRQQQAARKAAKKQAKLVAAAAKRTALAARWHPHKQPPFTPTQPHSALLPAGPSQPPQPQQANGGSTWRAHLPHWAHGHRGKQHHPAYQTPHQPQPPAPAGPHTSRAAHQSAHHPSSHGTHRNGAALVPPQANAAQGRGGEGPSGAPKMPWEGDPFWQIPWEQLKNSLICQLGSGSFGQVFEAYFHSAPMAVKVMKLADGATEAALQQFKQEVDLHRQLSMHPNVVRFCGACADISSGTRLPQSAGPGSASVTLAIVMELCRYGTLYKVIELARRVGRLPRDVRSRKGPRTKAQNALLISAGFKLWDDWLTRLKLAQQAAAALSYMHDCSVLHLDVTSHNLLVTENWEAKVADFNLSRAIARDSVPHSGSINSAQWAAPERLRGESYNKSADVFSFGVVVWELVTLEVPWRSAAGRHAGAGGSDSGSEAGDSLWDDGASDPTIFRDPFFHVLKEVPGGARLPLPRAQADKPLPHLDRVNRLIQHCWEQLPLNRPTMKEVCTELEAIIRLVDPACKGKGKTALIH